MCQGTIWVQRWTSLGDAEKLAEWYISLNERISKKLNAEPYKPLDRDGLMAFFRRIIDEFDDLSLGKQAETILSGLIFGQYMPNANHRTAMMLIVVWLQANGVDLSKEPEFTSIVSAYVHASKKDVERAYERAAQFQGAKRQSYLWESYWQGHLRVTKSFLESISPIKDAIQSGIWGRIPQNHLEILLTLTSSEV